MVLFIKKLNKLKKRNKKCYQNNFMWQKKKKSLIQFKERFDWINYINQIKHVIILMKHLRK